MKRVHYLIVVLAVVIAAVGIVYASGSLGLGREYNNTITVVNAKAIALPTGGGAFMKIINGYPERVCLVKAELAGYADAKVEIHKTVVDERGVARMQPVDEICIEPGGYVELKHGGYHIMIMNARLEEGSTITLKLYFDNGDTVTVEAPVKAKGRE